MDTLLLHPTRFLAGLALAAALAAPAHAGTLYKWTGPDGAVSYSDELKRIPEAYRVEAVAVTTGDLAGYSRFTSASHDASAEYVQRLDARLARLRELNQEPLRVATAAPPTAASVGSTVVRLNDRMSLEIPNDGLAGDEPIVVEHKRVRAPGDFYSTHVMVVRQGERILSVVKPMLPSQSNPKDWDDDGEALFGTDD